MLEYCCIISHKWSMKNPGRRKNVPQPISEPFHPAITSALTLIYYFAVNLIFLLLSFLFHKRLSLFIPSYISLIRNNKNKSSLQRTTHQEVCKANNRVNPKIDCEISNLCSTLSSLTQKGPKLYFMHWL